MNALTHVYNTLLVLGLLSTVPIWSALLASKPKHRAGFLQKASGRLDAVRGNRSSPVWYHAVSVGEVMASLPLVRALAGAFPQRPLWISTVTGTGQATARAKVPEATGVFYFPYDLPWLMDRVIRALRPGLFVTTETEIWPNCIWRLHRHGVPIALVNGRISDGSFAWYRRFRFVFRPVLSCFDMLCVQSPEMARRLRAMGAAEDRIRVTGNLKFDQRLPQAVDGSEWRERLGLPANGRMWVAGSTHPGEEEIVLAAHGRLRGRFGDLQLVLAPRAPERFDEVAHLVHRWGMTAVRRSVAGTGAPPSPLPEVILLDTVGELAEVYGVGQAAFVGGSLVPRGGHNPLEPAAHGRPVLFGPHMENFREIASSLVEEGGAWVVSGETLADRMADLLGSPDLGEAMGERAKVCLLRHRGAADCTADLLGSLLGRSPWG